VASEREVDPIRRGMLLGIANCVVIAVGMAAPEHTDGLGLGMIVFLVGVLPAIFAGCLLGWLAGKWASQPVRSRRLRLLIPAWLVVVALAIMTGLVNFILVSWIPTTVAVLLLERATRRPPAPPVPVARATL
jgi:hypothetical protein